MQLHLLSVTYYYVCNMYLSDNIIPSGYVLHFTVTSISFQGRYDLYLPLHMIIFTFSIWYTFFVHGVHSIPYNFASPQLLYCSVPIVIYVNQINRYIVYFSK